MKVPLDWLKEFVAVRLPPAQLAERLTLTGLEVKAVEETPQGIVFDIEVTPNRADCLSIIGVAREVAAATGQRLQLPPAGASKKATPQKDAPVSIHIEDKKGCQQYIGRVIESVKIGPSPEWMQKRLLACGLRSINNIVDITNYVLFECGQPLHAFDLTRLKGKAIRVRRADANEPITTLDGAKRALAADVLVIADAESPVAVAGIMGGQASEVTAQTTDILLESALFDPITIRRTSRKLGLSSESSYRFERGVDPEGVAAASARASALIQQLASGRETSSKTVGQAAPARKVIIFEPKQAAKWLGSAIDASFARTSFARLSCRVASSGTDGPMRVSVPSFRRDLNQPVDLYEEIARLAGYDRIAPSIPEVSLINPSGGYAETYQQSAQLRRLCAALGLQEAVTWSLLSENEIKRFGYPEKEMARLANPLSQDHAYLRPSLLIGLLQAVRHNASRGVPYARFFELGNVFAQSKEKRRLGIVISGDWSAGWANPKAPASFWVVKGLAQAVIQCLTGQAAGAAAAAVSWSSPREAATLLVGGKALGVVGKIAEPLLGALDLKQPVWAAELDVEALLDCRKVPAPVVAPPVFPPVKRDLSVVVNESVLFEQMIRVIQEAGRPQASRVELMDRFRGKSIPSGKYSVTFNLEYRDPQRTLTAQEIDQVHQRIVAALSVQFGATLR